MPHDIPNGLETDQGAAPVHWAHDYRRLATQAITDLIDTEHALLRTEIEARLADVSDPNRPHIDPHHLTEAIRRLLADGTLEELVLPTRGGQSIPILIPAQRPGKDTLVTRAAARKRLLYTRYTGWSRGAGTRPNLIGVAGERVTHLALQTVSPNAGYKLLKPEGAR